MEPDETIQKMHDALDVFEKLRDSSKGPCVKCKYHSVYRSLGGVGDWCMNPIINPPTYDVIDGKATEHSTPCRNERSSEGKCKPEGFFFAAKPPKIVEEEVEDTNPVVIIAAGLVVVFALGAVVVLFIAWLMSL
jgi:hypothetical protein